MERRVIEIDQESCNGCGKCVIACAEGAIGLINGKARLLRDDYCDGLGNCLPACPRDAIHFIVREAAPFDETAVKRHMLERSGYFTSSAHAKTSASAETSTPRPVSEPREPEKLKQWPIQLQLVDAAAAGFDEADLLVAADCTAYAHGNFHADYMDGRVAVIACPKLDDADYTDKLANIFREHDIKSVLVVRMDIPCCAGLESAVRTAMQRSGKDLPIEAVHIATDGTVQKGDDGAAQ